MLGSAAILLRNIRDIALELGRVRNRFDFSRAVVAAICKCSLQEQFSWDWVPERN